MRAISVLLMSTALLFAAGCKPAGEANGGAEANNSSEQSSQTNEEGNTTSNTNRTASCAIEKNYDWLAEAHVQSGKKVAVVSGKIDVKSAGYTATLTEGAVDAGPPPVQHLTLNVTEPTGQQAQQITTIPVTITVPIAGPKEKVAIDCAGQEIARTDVVRP